MPVFKLKFVETDIRACRIIVPRLGKGLVFQESLLNVFDSLLKSFREFLEIFLVEENLVFVEDERTITLHPALTLRNREVVVIVSFRCLYIKEVRTLPGTDRLRIYVFRVALPGITPFEIFTIHFFFALLIDHKCRKII